MSDNILKLDKSFGELAASCVRGVRTKSEMEGRICTLLVDLQRYHQNYSKGLEARVKELEQRLKSAEEYQNEINDGSMWGNVNEDVS